MFNTFSTKKAHRRIDELEEELAKLKRAFSGLEMDWANTQDKLKQMMGRIAKRAELMHDVAESEGKLAPPDIPPEIEPHAYPMWNRLTPQQKRTQLEILRRRANGG